MVPHHNKQNVTGANQVRLWRGKQLTNVLMPLLFAQRLFSKQQLWRNRLEDRHNDGIIRGKFSFGEKLSDRALAASLGISRTPVREALASLAREGLVIIRSEALDSAPEARNRVIGFCRPGGIDRDKPHSLYAEIVICSKLLGPDGNPDQLDHTLLHELMHFLGLDLTFKLPAAAVAGPDGMVVQVHGPGGSACATLMTTRLQPEPEEGDGQVNGCRTQ